MPCGVTTLGNLHVPTLAELKLGQVKPAQTSADRERMALEDEVGARGLDAQGRSHSQTSIALEASQHDISFIGGLHLTVDVVEQDPTLQSVGGNLRRPSKAYHAPHDASPSAPRTSL